MADYSGMLDVASDSTLAEIRDHLAVVATKAELDMVTTDSESGSSLTPAQIQKVVQSGLASHVWEVGEQVVTTYTYNGTEYEMPWDIVHFGNVELEDGETVPGMWLQSHYATAESVMFDSYEAFYYAEDGLEAGTYNITAGNTTGNLTSGTSYQFTLTEDVPAGGLLAGFRRHLWDVSDVTTLYVYSYESNSSGYSDYIEAVAISEGSEGTNLGTFYTNSSAADSGLNHAHRFMYGYNRWSQSACRQWLNSDADAGEWWEPQNDYDLAPEQLSTYAGFMQGLPSDFLAVLGKVKVTTALNTVEGLTDTSEDTYDTFFLPSLEQIFVTPQLSGVEGDYWEYWARVLGLSEPEAQYSTNEDRITYALNSKSSAQYVRLRSAYRGNAASAWHVSSAGNVGSSYASSAYRCAPACVIC